MKVVNAHPPNFEQILKAIPGAGRPHVVFTYGDTLYVPGGEEIPEHLFVHEETHTKQQLAMGIKKWWEKYLENPKFRLSQEVEAYGMQYSYICAFAGWPRHKRKMFLLTIANHLSSPIYGNIVTREKAAEYIKRGSI